MKYNVLPRIRILEILVFIFFSFLIFKLFLTQIVSREEYRALADRQYATPSENIFERHSIFFKKKDESLVNAATTVMGYKLAINPKEITKPDQILEKLSKIIKINSDDFFKKTALKNDPYEEIANRLSKEEADKIRDLKISGLYLYKEKWRFYPGGNLAAQVIGFLGYQENDFAGRYGLERTYDDILAEQDKKIYINFFAEVFSSLSDTFFDNPKKGGDIVTTLEPSVQAFAEVELEKAIKKWQAENGGVIIMNPKDGGLYALGSYPNFNLNEFSKVSQTNLYSNPLVENVYEFGSTIKPLTMAAGLEAGVITPETKYEDKGFVVVENKEIRNFDKKGRGLVDMQEVLNQSLNTGAVFVMQKLGKEKYRQAIYNYGLNEKTGIDLPNEARSLVENLKSKRELEYATASFGQGVAFSSLEIIRAFASLGNGGFLIKPHVVDKILYKDGSQEKKNYPPSGQIIKKETSETITRMLVAVADKSLVTTNYNLSQYSLAAKTGTAQIAKEDGIGYYEDKHLHSLIGYFPAYDPKFILLYYLFNPKAKYAVETLREPFLNTSKFLLNYYEIPPDR